MVDTADMDARSRSGKSASAFRTISEVSTDLDVPQHVLRFWESKFPQIRPLKRGGGRRYYRPDDVELLRRIQVLLYKEGYTIKGVQRLLKESRGAVAPPPADVIEASSAGAEPTPARPPTAALDLFDEHPDALDEEGGFGPEEGDAQPPDHLLPEKRDELMAILAELHAISRLLRS